MSKSKEPVLLNLRDSATRDPQGSGGQVVTKSKELVLLNLRDSATRGPEGSGGQAVSTSNQLALFSLRDVTTRDPEGSAGQPVSISNEPELHFLLEEENDVVRWRRRTLFLFAVMGEVLFLLLLYAASGFIQRHERLVAAEAEQAQSQEQTTFLVMPPDLLRQLRKTPQTNNLSDKNRLAHGPSPVVNPHGLRMPYMKGNTSLPKIAGGSPPPKPMTPPSQTSAATPPAQKQMAQPQPKPPEDAQKQGKIMLSDVTPPPAPNPEAAARLGMATPSQAIQQSLQDAARGRSAGTIPGPGLSPEQLNNLNPNFSTSGPIILSDTRGVDFGPYLAQILEIVRQNWYAVIPEAARLGAKGRVALVFEILKDGSVPQLSLVGSSGQVSLDRAAEAGIRASIPFPPLPQEFTGHHLVLQFNFFYNMTP